jgi:hypothetical protein
VIKILLRMNLFWGLCIVVGCSDQAETTIPAPVVVRDAGVDKMVVSLAEIELKTLRLGARSSAERAKLVEARIAYLTELIRDPSKGSWSDDNSTREACLMLEAQLSALAVGRGIAFSAEQVKSRMKRLQSLLIQAGYNFDESGNEQKWNENGNRRDGYTPLLD